MQTFKQLKYKVVLVWRRKGTVEAHSQGKSKKEPPDKIMKDYNWGVT